MKKFSLFNSSLTIFFLIAFSLIIDVKGKTLPVNEAFNLKVKTEGRSSVKAIWDIESGYLLYKDQMNITVAGNSETELGKIKYPEGIKQHSEVLGDYFVYKNKLKLEIPVEKWGQGKTELLFKYQGCKGKKMCYPPVSKIITLPPPASLNLDKEEKAFSEKFPETEMSSAQQILSEGNFFVIIIGFFVFGLFLSLTPCVLPMVPILVGIILGQKDIKTYKAFTLSVVYVLGMAVTYAIAGVITAMLGSSVQAVFQNFWIVLACCILFVLLALSLFGLYELQLPPALMNRLNKASNKAKGGTYAGVFFMGIISSLIVSPCVSAPLAGTLIYIASTGNIVLGATALFSLAVGMGIILIIAGTTGGKLFLKTGSWMMIVRYFLGVVMLGMAIWLLSRVVSQNVTYFLWGLLLIGVGIYMGAIEPAGKSPKQKFIKLIAFFIMLTGTGIFLNFFINLNNGSVYMNTTKPETSVKNNIETNEETAGLFNVIKTEKQLQKYIKQAQEKNKPIMIDFYADWCTACKEMEQETFSNPSVRRELKNFITLKADVTESNSETRALQKKYNVFGPPYIVFLNPQGKKLNNFSVAGKVDSDKLVNKLDKIKTLIR
ncbi:MAG: protein-disulfide reductase DsbD [Victivallales bacterium]|nr:protein-disulfide reductase DsbD [Victivallales bacterium]